MQKASFRYERTLWQRGVATVAGVDEVGRGAWAGPLLAAAVVFPPKTILRPALRDSKTITPKRRIELAEKIKERALAFSFGQADISLIEKRGIAFATEQAMIRALNDLKVDPEFVLVDFFNLRTFPGDRQEALKRGDQLSASIAAASILAKVERDTFMSDLDRHYPGYGFASHKGYGTRGHREAIKERGITKAHRLSFIPAHL